MCSMGQKCLDLLTKHHLCGELSQIFDKFNQRALCQKIFTKSIWISYLQNLKLSNIVVSCTFSVHDDTHVPCLSPNINSYELQKGNYSFDHIMTRKGQVLDITVTYIICHWLFFISQCCHCSILVLFAVEMVLTIYDPKFQSLT